MSEYEPQYPLSKREKAAFFATGLVFEAMGVVAGVGEGDYAAGAILFGLGLGSQIIAKWGEFGSTDATRIFDSMTRTFRDENGQPL